MKRWRSIRQNNNVPLIPRFWRTWRKNNDQRLVMWKISCISLKEQQSRGKSEEIARKCHLLPNQGVNFDWRTFEFTEGNGWCWSKRVWSLKFPVPIIFRTFKKTESYFKQAFFLPLWSKVIKISTLSKGHHQASQSPLLPRQGHSRGLTPLQQGLLNGRQATKSSCSYI